jgi:hypothetical protein
VYDLDIYNEEFYALAQREGVAMAKWLVPVLRRTFVAFSMIDVGCGTGYYVKEWDSHAIGLEGSAWGIEHSLVPRRVLRHDLRLPLHSNVLVSLWKDLVLSLEVAEHVEQEFADTYVDTLCALGNSIAITAATPGQGGTAHINEQPHEYWEEKFVRRGFKFDTARHESLRAAIFAAEDRGDYVTPWLAPNIQVFRRRGT